MDQKLITVMQKIYIDASFSTEGQITSTLRLDRPLDSSADLTYLRLSRPLETIIKSPLFNPKNQHPIKLFLIHRFIRTNHY